MFHKEATDKRSTKASGWAERESHDDKEGTGRRLKSERWYWPIDPVNILDIRQLADDKGQSSTRGYLMDIIGGDSKSSGFSKAGENMQNLKSSLVKIGMDIRQEEVVLEDDSKYDPNKLRRPKEGSKPRVWSSRPDVTSEKPCNVFHARSRDAGISASWTRFSQDESLD